jgi:hypothetical protein
MLPVETETTDQRDALWPVIALWVIPALLVAAILVLTYRNGRARTIFDLSNYLGPSSYSFAFHRAFDVPMQGGAYRGIVILRATRMPLPPIFLAVAYKLFGNQMLRVDIWKTCCFLVPLVMAAALAFRRSSRKWASACILIVPFFIPNFLLLTTSMQIEEGYYYGFLALATAILIFHDLSRELSGYEVVAIAVSLGALYLCKSSLRLTCVVILLLTCCCMQRWSRRLILTTFLMLLMAGWGLYQKNVSGRFTTGSSLDGFNLHKGNYAAFLDRYPPADNGYIDRWDGELSPIHAFSDEWSFNDYHLAAAKDFIVHHPLEALRADLVKGDIYWLSLRDIGSGHVHDVFTRVDLINMILMRLTLLSAIGWACYSLAVHSRGPKGSRATVFASVAVLSILASVSIPYLLGFALTRHASVLIYPATLYLCRIAAA